MPSGPGENEPLPFTNLLPSPCYAGYAGPNDFFLAQRVNKILKSLG